MKLRTGALAAALALSLAACTTDAPQEPAAAGTSTSDASFQPVTIEHVYGETTITEQPERIATVAWANHEVPLALGVVPVGMAKVTWGDDDSDGVLPWVSEKLEELGAGEVALFDETDSIDFEAVAATEPDVIFASYSGITQEDYDQLSKIAPTIAYPEQAWSTPLAENIEIISQAMGKEAEGKTLVEDLNAQVASAFAAHPEFEGTNVLFTAFGGESDLSKIGFYTTADPRAGFLQQAGFGVPKTVAQYSETSESFWEEVSAEQPELFDDVDLIVTYGSDDPAENEALLKKLQEDPLWSKIPAIAEGNVAFLGNGPLAASTNPTPLSIPWGINDYFDQLAEALN
ncbi:iron-siderophore ABC transporter substrate-binding protein [Corynebacterium kozikiae]|uniref:iron-siderophore ABC transporter substrate-binding protein n=1 Tax=Corynebacterium kozikiae TaxID=2968469 RepID=UPI00211C02F9|nr:iron-siderophore ABC transporter substrate-binding protein [Corynebacterium sp. 76QC2CO]MCQ9343496.1 iron-siderophore ABC transporter substrate-binding protein [Corynebacterium sp. 76QC2CO]